MACGERPVRGLLAHVVAGDGGGGGGGVGGLLDCRLVAVVRCPLLSRRRRRSSCSWWHLVRFGFSG